MPFAEDDLVPISALQHLAFCERQCALIHNEQLWAENRLTAEGKVVHQRAHGQETETRGAIRSVRGLHIRSLEHGISGIADVVEFHAPEGRKARELSREDFWNSPESLNGWTVLPIEYKRGKRKSEHYDEVQLCAQALCLEEMLRLTISRGALFYAQEQGRIDVEFDDKLRGLTIATCVRLRQLLYSELTPPAVHKPYCAQCSLIEQCMPTVTEGATSVRVYFAAAVASNMEGAVPAED